MKKTVLDRYERTVSGSIVIDVAAKQVEELYNEYDWSAPFIHRDLDQDLVEYLIDCAREIDTEPFVVMFTLNQFPDGNKQSRVCRSVNAYFLYLVEIERQKIKQMFSRSAILFSIGLIILFLSVYVNEALGKERSYVANVFAEGLTIAAWISLWESLAILLIEWLPQIRSIRLYRRLANAKLIFRQNAPQKTEETPQKILSVDDVGTTTEN